MATLVEDAMPMQPPRVFAEASASHRHVHFEVSLKRGSRWVIESVNPDRKSALKDAEHLLQLGENEGVRVTKEVINTRTEAAASLIVFERLVTRHHLKPSLLTGSGQAATRRPSAKSDNLDRSWFDQPYAVAATTTSRTQDSRAAARARQDLSWRRVSAVIVSLLGLATAAAVLMAVFV
ncbi:MAG: hypothetical protein AAFY56_03615 [Pseudomonadota bacterium]